MIDRIDKIIITISTFSITLLLLSAIFASNQIEKISLILLCQIPVCFLLNCFKKIASKAIDLEKKERLEVIKKIASLKEKK